jgi:hypothetical protein
MRSREKWAGLRGRFPNWESGRRPLNSESQVSVHRTDATWALQKKNQTKMLARYLSCYAAISSICHPHGCAGAPLPLILSLSISQILYDAGGELWQQVCLTKSVSHESQRRRKEMKVKSNLKAGQSSAAILD